MSFRPAPRPGGGGCTVLRRSSSSESCRRASAISAIRVCSRFHPRLRTTCHSPSRGWLRCRLVWVVPCALPWRECCCCCMVGGLCSPRAVPRGSGPEPPTAATRSLEGMGPGRIPFANSPAGACDAAPAPRCLACVFSCWWLTPGARVPERLWGFRLPVGPPWLGPGFLASPMRAPSCQSWLASSGLEATRESWVAPLGGLPSSCVGCGGCAWAWSGSVFHRRMSSRIGVVVAEKTCS